jgi:trypsin
MGGTVADAATHPFQVGLVAKAIANNDAAQFCGGSLVSERFVVTAAHCSDFQTNAPGQVEVLVGTQRLDGTGSRVGVARVHIHPRWRKSTMDYDVAVWELATPVTGIAFATLAGTQPTVAGTPLRVTGWGRLSESPTPRTLDLMQVDVPFVSTNRRFCGLQRGVTARMICAGEAGKDSCKGDSGGPLTINRGSGFTELVGIVSFGNGCGRANYPGVYANVAEGRINSFIRSIAFAPPRIITVAAPAQTVNEGGRRVTLWVQRTSTQGTARVRFATAPGTALARSDFRARTGTVSFRSGQASAAFTITLVNDRVKEGDETFSVTIFQPSAGWSIGSAATTTVTITDND